MSHNRRRRNYNKMTAEYLCPGDFIKLAGQRCVVVYVDVNSSDQIVVRFSAPASVDPNSLIHTMVVHRAFQFKVK